MAQWYHPIVLGFFSILFINYGVLYLMFNSNFNEMCDYTGVVASCTNYDSWVAPDDRQFVIEEKRREWHRHAQVLRNESEKEKCTLEEDLQKKFQNNETSRADAIIAECMASFWACRDKNAPFTTTTTTTTTTFDCSHCDKLCQKTSWTTIDPVFAAQMGYTGTCTAKLCPWGTECQSAAYGSNKCLQQGCKCQNVPCPTTTSTTTTNTTTTTTTSTTSSTTTTVITTTTTNISTTSTTTSTTLSAQGPCTCDPVDGFPLDTVIVGRPSKLWLGKTVFTKADLMYWQGVHIYPDQSLTLSASQSAATILMDCNGYFSNRTNYVGPQDPTQEANHIDLGCGYSGSFSVKCERDPSDAAYCSYKSVDISTCVAPSYTKAVQDCYTVATTTTTTTLGDVAWLGINKKSLEFVNLNPKYPIPTQAPLSRCCEPHVSSTCRKGVDFTWPVKTTAGAWMPSRPWAGHEAYFPMVKCADQAVTTRVACPLVQIFVNSTSWQRAPSCTSVCNLAWANARLNELCSIAQHPDREAEEKKTHKAKIESMKRHQSSLESWTKSNSMITVRQTKKVIDCVDQNTLPSRYNEMQYPKVSSGFDKMPLSNECRVHRCKPNQCLVERQDCPLPYVHKSINGSTAEVIAASLEVKQCDRFSNTPRKTFECVDKVGISSSNPMSLGFGLAWVILGLGFGGAALYLVYREKNQVYKIFPEGAD